MSRVQDSAVANEPAPWTSGRIGPPRVQDATLVRRRLFRALDLGTRRPVTLVCAGAGWGKTALVASWARARPGPGPVAWLTLARHDDPRRFWSAVLEALGLAGAIARGSPLGTMPVPQKVDDAFLGRLARELAGLPVRTVLVLDDVHVPRDAATLDGLARLLRDLPDRLRVVLIGRSVPVVLHLLRVAGELAEIRTPHLAFRAQEIVDLLALRGRRPSRRQAGRLLDRTEGWPVGLHLFGDVFLERGVLELDDLPDTVREYLIREVVFDQAPGVARFLLRTSIPEQICGDLADALVAGQSGEPILESLERANMFISHVDGAGGPWFRYRGLFREVLRRELQAREPESVAGVHVRTAQWYAARRLPATALSHAAAAGSWALLAWIATEQALPMALSNDRAALIEVLRGIPPERFADTAELALCAAMLLLAGDDYAAAGDQLARVRAMVARRELPDRATIELAVDVMRIVIGPRVRGDMPELIADATRLLAKLATMRVDRLPILLQYRAIALCFKGIGLLWADRFDPADQYLWAASTAARTTGLDLVEITALAHLAVLVYLQGSLREAERLVDAAQGLARRGDLGLPTESAAAHLTQAMIEVERNRLPEAQEALRRGLHAAGERPEAALAIVETIVRAHLLLARDEAAAARELLRRSRADLGPPLVAPLIGRWLALAESEADAALGDAAAVLARYARPAAAVVLLPAEQVLLARAYEATGDHAAAEDLLVRVREGPDAVSAVTAWVVTALIADAQGQAGRSADALAHAVLRAEVDGIRRPFRRFDSRRMGQLAERQRWLYEEHGPVTSGVLAEVEGEHGFPPLPVLPDRLSERERDVLRYLPTVLTASEIAADLTISVNTVKAHMRSIYRKLGAARRREAVVRARQAGLL